MKKKIYRTIFLAMLTFMVLSGCQSSPISTPDPDTPVSSADPINYPPANDFTGYQQNVYVDRMEVYLLESFLMQVSVTVIGNLPDGCTSIIGSKSNMVDETTFEIFIYTNRPEDMTCTMALVPFEETIMLDVNGLPAGNYTVRGFGFENSFSFDFNNQ